MIGDGGDLLIGELSLPGHAATEHRLADFVRQITVQRVTKKGLAAVGPSVITLALAEGLVAHAASIAVRLHSADRTRDQEPRTKDQVRRRRT